MRIVSSCLIMLGCLVLAASGAQARTILIQNNYYDSTPDPSNPNYTGHNHRRLSLVDSHPSDRDKTNKIPSEVRLKFSRDLDPSHSTVHVYNSFGAAIDASDATVEGDTMTLALMPNLTRGRYVVKWKAQCDCEQEEIHDSFRFNVR